MVIAAMLIYLFFVDYANKHQIIILVLLTQCIAYNF